MPVRLIPAVAYLRASSKKQDKSVPEQRRQITEYAKGRYKIVAWYIDDGKSGSHATQKRTDFNRLLTDSSSGKFLIVLCLDVSRFGRLDSIEGAYAKKTLRDAGVTLHTILEGDIDWNSTTGRIVDAVLSEREGTIQ